MTLASRSDSFDGTITDNSSIDDCKDVTNYSLPLGHLNDIRLTKDEDTLVELFGRQNNGYAHTVITGSPNSKVGDEFYLNVQGREVNVNITHTSQGVPEDCEEKKACMPSSSKEKESSRGRKLIFSASLGILVLILIILVTIWLVLPKNKTGGDIITTVPPASTPSYRTIISREIWGAAEPKGPYVSIPAPSVVVIKHTGGLTCTDFSSCCLRIREIQKMHMDFLNMIDISYNFLIGGDRRIYSGRGWAVANEDIRNDTVDIAFIGNFSENVPSSSMLLALDRIILQAPDKGLNYSRHMVVNHNQTEPTDSPGAFLFAKVTEEVNHYSSDVCYKVKKDGGVVVNYSCPQKVG